MVATMQFCSVFCRESVVIVSFAGQVVVRRWLSGPHTVARP